MVRGPKAGIALDVARTSIGSTMWGLLLTEIELAESKTNETKKCINRS